MLLSPFSALWHLGIFRPDLILSDAQLTITGLQTVGDYANSALVGDHASIGAVSVQGGVTSLRWGLVRAEVEDGGTPSLGTAVTPDDFTAADTGAPLAPAVLWASGLVNGERVFTSAAIRAPKPVRTTAPDISTTGTGLGDTVNITPGVWVGAASVVTTLFADAVPIAAPLTISASEDNKQITGQDVATSSGGDVIEAATGVFTVADFFAPTVADDVAISGTPEVGSALGATGGTVTGNPTPTITWQWYRGASEIPGATASGYTLVAADEGLSNIAVRKTATNPLSSAFDEASLVATIRYPAPVASGALADQSFAPNSGNQTLDASPDFTFAGSPQWSVQTGPAGVTIDASGVVTFDTNTLSEQVGTPIVVRLADANDPTRFADSAFSLDIASATGVTINSVTDGAVVNRDLPVTIDTVETPDDASTVYYVLVPQGSGQPNIAQIKLGQQQSGAAASDAWTSLWTASPPDHTLVTGLDAFFDLYVVIDTGADSNVGAALNFEVDTINPIVSAVTGTQTGSTTADWGVTSTEADGVIYAAVRLDTDPVLSDVNIENGTGNAIDFDTDATPTADANNGGSFVGLTADTNYRVDSFQKDEFGNPSDVATSAVFTTAAAAGFSKASVGNAGASGRRMERVAAFANTVDGTRQMQFASVTMPSTWTNTLRPMQFGSGEGGLRINVDGSIRSRIYDGLNTQIGSTANTGATALAAGDLLNIMAIWDTNGDCELWYKINASAWVLGFTQTLSSGAIIDNTLGNGLFESPKNIAENFDAIHRLALWLNNEAVIDFSVAANRDKLVDGAGDIANPATGNGEYGVPALDLHEPAATWNLSTGNNSGNGGDLTSPGGYTDV